MEQTLRWLGFGDEQIQDAVKHCKSVEEAILYLPDSTLSSKKRSSCPVPEIYEIDEKEAKVIDLTEDKEKKEDSSFKVHFRGDTVFCNHISAIHRINEKRYFNFNKIFNVNYSLKHDSNITHMFLSSFVFSQELLQKLVALHTNAEITFASHLDPTEPDRDPVTLNEGKCLLVFPPFPHMFSYGCFHSKLILIRFPDRLRVVISSANLCEEDWNEWSQCVWTQDFFNAPEGEKKVAAKHMDLEFRTRLITLLKQCQCPEDRVFGLLRGILFSNVRVQLVTSIPGIFSGQAKQKYGHLRLRSILASLREFEIQTGIQTSVSAPILSLCSSLGSPSPAWLSSILASCHGVDMLPPGVKPAEMLHMVYPTLAYVKASRIGPDMAGSLILQRKHYQMKSFPKQSLKRYCDAEGRENCLPHAKYLMNVPMRNCPRLPWIYVGSHNFTRSAWGSLQKKDSEFVMNNYECGVVLLPKSYVDYANGDMKIEQREKGERREADLCGPLDLIFEAPCLPYRMDDIPFCQLCVCSTFVTSICKWNRIACKDNRVVCFDGL